MIPLYKVEKDTSKIYKKTYSEHTQLKVSLVAKALLRILKKYKLEKISAKRKKTCLKKLNASL